MGDMKFSWDGNADINPGYGIWFGKQLTPSLGVRFQAVNSKLSGTGLLPQGSDGTELPAEFRASVFEYNINAFYYFFKPAGNDAAPRAWNLYATAGAGYAHWITDAYSLVDQSFIDGNGHKPHGKGINGRTLEAVFPVGLGADFSITDKLRLNLESNLHTVSSDILDNKTGGFPYDQYLYTSAGLTYQFNANITLWKTRTVELARYFTDPDDLPLKYTTFFSTTGGAVNQALVNEKPDLIVKIPTKLYAEPEANIVIDFQNAGREGILDLDFAFQPEFQMEVSDKKRFHLTPNGQGANIQFKVQANDTSRINTFRLLTAGVPNGSFPFLMTGKFVAYSGETFHFKSMEYIEKDARQRRPGRNTYDSLPADVLSGIKFRVQILSNQGNPVPKEKIEALFPNEKEIREEHDNGWYYYTTGLFSDRSEAEAFKEQLEKSTGLSGMYTVMYQNDKRSHQMDNIYDGYKSQLGQFNALGKNGPGRNKLSSAQRESQSVDEYRVRFFVATEFRASMAELETKMGTEEVITEHTEGDTFYYFAGSFKKRNVANAYATYLKERIGFQDAVVVAFKKGNPVEK